MVFPTETEADRIAGAAGDSRETRERAIAVLDALRLYRAAESAMRRRTRESMSMTENDLLLLRYLLRAQSQERPVTPGDLARYLGVSTASMTAIVDRLEASGHVRREAHPSDRRRLLVHTTEHADVQVRATLHQMHERMFAAVADMPPENTEIVLRFLARVQDAVDAVDAE